MSVFCLTANCKCQRKSYTTSICARQDSSLTRRHKLVKTHLEVAKQMKAAKEAEDAELGQRKENTDDE